jgi:hypothetical protein
MTDHDLNIRDATDPFYLQIENHSVSGKGVYCPNENVHYDPLPGQGDGDPCPVCGEQFSV